MQGTPFGTLADGREVSTFILGERVVAAIATYGARLVSLRVPVGGTRREVLLGHRALPGIEADTAYMGAVVGRYGNRIRGGRFVLDGRPVQGAVNNGGHMLHGGTRGFDRAVWRAEPDGAALLLHHTSPDGDQGFPGRLDATLRYGVEDDRVTIDYTATADAPTVVNLTNHAYFNLAGEGDVLEHEVTLFADRYTPVDEGLIPTGERAPVAGTPFDFRSPRRIGAHIGDANEQLARGQGYDHNMVLADAPRATPQPAALVRAGGLTLEVATTEPGLQFYSGNFLPEAGWPHRAALCLETQHFPDSPNRPDFPTTVVRPGQTLRSRTVLRFAEY